MRYCPLNVRALLAFALLCLNAVEASRDYQLVLNVENATESVESKAIWWAGYWFTAKTDVWFNCEFLEPGEKAARRLEGGDGWRGRDDEEEGGTRTLRGRNDAERDLQVLSCPSKCSSSKSTKCKTLGCAFCGRCRRTRDLQETNQTETRLTPAAALKVEKWFNSYLMSFCRNTRGCMMYAKIFRLLNNGTSYALTGNTIAL